MNKEETITIKKYQSPTLIMKKLLKIFTEDTDFITDLNINSANLVDIILDVEDYFKIHIDNESMEKMIDVKSTLEIIETKLAKKVIGNDIGFGFSAKKAIGNDRYLDKIFTQNEQLLIATAEIQISWFGIWSRKEAAYNSIQRSVATFR
jgi:acyl carrier protein